MEKWELWLKSEKALEKDINAYVRRKVITSVSSPVYVSGHLAKANSNLKFAYKIVETFNDYYDWSIAANYYAVYHSALSLCASKGYETKSHMATLAVLIRHFYPKHVGAEELDLLSRFKLGEGEIMDLVRLKKYREDASYSISQPYGKSMVLDLHEKASSFVRKAELILKN